MANLKEIRTRISSVSSTMQITSAMKMVSAAKLRKAQDRVVGFRPYADKLQSVISDLSGSDIDDNIYAKERDLNKILIVVVSSNKGLCGAFNSNVVKKALALNEDYSGKKIEFACIGKKAVELLTYRGLNVVKSYNSIYDDLSFDNSTKISGELMNLYVGGEYDRIHLIYNSFKNAASQILKVEQYLPIITESEEGKVTQKNDYIYEPTKQEILENVIPIALKTQVYKAIIDSFASEHGARMTAMHKATDNANEMVKDLTLKYNKARQASITNEILEIVSGAEALNN
jgi:F-type H+-transporting ATPase subunit gamma